MKEVEQQTEFPTCGSLIERFEWLVKWRGFEEVKQQTSNGVPPEVTTGYYIGNAKAHANVDLSEFPDGDSTTAFLKGQQVEAIEFLDYLAIDYPELVI